MPEGLCDWGIHVYEDGTVTVKMDMGDDNGYPKALDTVSFEFVWAESQVRLRRYLG